MGVVIIVRVFVVKSVNHENPVVSECFGIFAFVSLHFAYIPNFAVPMCNCDELMVNLEY